MTKKIIFILSLFFVFLSFSPTLYELNYAKNLPKDRALELVHNYVFDYNFYLSRIREGQEGRWFVTEKYYNKPHSSSLFQIVYLYLGKIGALFRLSPPAVYHISRIIFGFILLLVIGKLVISMFTGWWSVVSYLLIVTAGSWPILVKLGDFWRFSTHWGGWSAIDSLERITFIPHVLLGQIFLLLFIWKFCVVYEKKNISGWFWWWNLGLIAGIIFPPILITVYTIFVVLSVLEVIGNKSIKELKSLILPKVVFGIFSIPAILYLQIMFKVQPWHALAIFDIQHRSTLPYTEYFWALGPVLPLGIGGLILALVRKDKKYYPFIAWIMALGLLFVIFEHVPQQSPTRFTQMLINVPIGILTTYLFYTLWYLCDKCKRSLTSVSRLLLGIVITNIMLLGMSVMLSSLGWQMDQVKWKREGTWLYPVGVELVYPLKDFMDGIGFFRLNTKTSDIVLAYEAAGNYIPAYAGNYVYLGHANTPDEDNKLKIAARFFSGKMSQEEAKEFLTRENIKYIFFGPQEKELGNINNMLLVYPFLTSLYTNSRVTIYK